MIKLNIKSYIKGLSLAGAIFFALLTLVPTGANAQNLCESTANEALRACRLDVLGEYRLALGKCDNIADLEEREECKDEAREELWEAWGECPEQYEARLEICDTLGPDAYDPEIDPEDFMSPEDIAANPNPYLPLVPGTVKVFEAETEDGTERIEVTVTDDTKDILDVECIVVRDTVSIDEELVEDTFDWFTQDKDGNVWYFGEISLNYEDGELVDIEGSWTAGEDGAKPGIVMPEVPQVGSMYRQEFLLGEAEDMGQIYSLSESVSVPYGFFADCLMTRDWTPIEPDVTEYKYYAPGVGVVLEANFADGEMVELVDFTSGE